ncbi:MAG: hypothetical protein VYA55_01025 [Pseudomonadota bacterium]|nr:hypothetical protein [Pseudomonadota bacterium]
MRVTWFGLVACGLLTALSLNAAAAVTQQHIVLQPGWNAIYVELDPDDGDDQTPATDAEPQDNAPARVFDVPEIEMVWNHPKALVSPQYPVLPSEIGFNDPGWRLYIPGTSTEFDAETAQALTNLFAVNAGEVYLVKLSGSAPKNLTITGRPRLHSIRWQPNQFNLVGFYVDPAAPTSFADYLNLSAAQSPEIYELNSATGTWDLLSKNAQMSSGKGYWVFNDGNLQLTSPLEVDLASSNGVAFLPHMAVRSITLTNRSAQDNPAISIAVDTGFSASGMSLQYFAGYDTSNNNQPQWHALAGFNPLIGAGKSSSLLLGLDRAGTDTVAQGVLTITGAGTRLRVPLLGEPLEPEVGLWAGVVMLDQVNHVNGTVPDQLEATVAPMTVKLLLHDNGSTVHLLKEVYLVSEVATDNSTQSVLLTDDSELFNYHGIALNNRREVGYRLSSSAFDFTGTKLALSGDLQSELNGVIQLQPDLPTHPMKHRYHTDHDGVQNSQEVWDITRTIKLTPDQQFAPSPEAGQGRIVGVYEEQITGVHKSTVRIRGRFVLERVNRIAQLDP